MKEKLIAIAFLFVLGVATVVRAQWVVFEPTNCAEAAAQLLQLE